MEKLIKRLEEKLSYSVEVIINDDDTIIIKSGDDKPPEQQAFRREFNSSGELLEWIALNT